MFQQAHQVFTGIAFHTLGFFVIFPEALLADIAVIAFQLLFRHQLDTEIRGLAAALAVLTRRGLTFVERALGATPEVDAKASVNLVFRINTLRHNLLSRWFTVLFQIVPVVHPGLMP